jgi:preprotein translocase SecE subunit
LDGGEIRKMETYKAGQAKTSRTLVLLTGLFLVFWGGISLVLALPQLWSKLGLAWNELLMDALPAQAWKLDLVIVETFFGPALTIAVLVAVGTGFWWWRFLNRPKWADLLIEMELELKKVSWPAPSDAWQSTLVVTGFTIALVATILFYDLVIRGILELIAGAA